MVKRDKNNKKERDDKTDEDEVDSSKDYDDNDGEKELKKKERRKKISKTVDKGIWIWIIGFGLIAVVCFFIWRFTRKDKKNDDNNNNNGPSSSMGISTHVTISQQPEQDKSVMAKAPQYNYAEAAPNAFAYVPESAKLASEYYRPGKTVLEPLSALFMAVAEQEGMMVMNADNATSLAIVEPDKDHGLRLLTYDAKNTDVQVPPATTRPDRTPAEDALKQAMDDAKAAEYCPSTQYVYIPPSQPGVKGSCVPKCAKDEELVLWRTPKDSAYAYHCRKNNCGPSLSSPNEPAAMNYDEGLCKRRIYNPEFFNDEIAMMPEYGFNNDRTRMYQTLCGQSNKRLMGRHCYDTGGWGRDTKSPNKWKPVPFSSDAESVLNNQGFKKSTDGLFYYKCRPGTILRGNDADGYFCVEPCPENSTDEGMGSTYQCYLKSIVHKPEPAMK